MDFERIKQNLRLRSGRTKQNLSKRFPTKEREPDSNSKQEEERRQRPARLDFNKVPGTLPVHRISNRRSDSAGAGKKTRFATDEETETAASEKASKARGSGEEKAKKSALKNGKPVEPTPERQPQPNIDGEQPLEDPKAPAPVAEASRDHLEHPEDSANTSPSSPELETQDLSSPPATEITLEPSQPHAVSMPTSNPEPTSESGEPDYDLRPSHYRPKPRSTPIETLSELLFSEGYLSTLTTHPGLLARFTSFLSRYKPDASPLVPQFIGTRKILKAIEYANAVAASLPNTSPTSPVAELSSAFRDSSKDAFNTLLSEALPAWVTYSIVKTATACLTAEISNRSTPLTKDIVGGLSEVFCITDPTQPDNPIIYSSEEFYRLTKYDKEAVIGHNCRFLQGARTMKESVGRLRDAIRDGKEISETLLNYRRDGTPFVNVLMLAPLHDDRGKVRYYLGAQVDATRLVEGGRGIEGFERFLVKRELEMDRGRSRGSDKKKEVLAKLRDLSLTFDLEESAVVQSNSRSNSLNRQNRRDGSAGSTERPRTGRRMLNNDEDEDGESPDENDEVEQEDKNNQDWKLAGDRPSGTLPGIYQKYLLIRPYPSLRIVFVSQAMRKMAQLQQRPFLSHVAAPAVTLAGLRESLETGTPVTGKVALMPKGGKREGTASGKWGRKTDDAPERLGRPCWISATPLLDSEDKVGVWMVVVVDRVGGTAHLERMVGSGQEEASSKSTQEEKEKVQAEDLPIKPRQISSSDVDDQPERKDDTPQEPDGLPSPSSSPPPPPPQAQPKHRPTDSGYGEDFATSRPPQRSTQEQEHERNHDHDPRSAPDPSSSTSTSPSLSSSKQEIFSDAEDIDASIRVKEDDADMQPANQAIASPNGSTPPTLKTPSRSLLDPQDEEQTPTRLSYKIKPHSPPQSPSTDLDPNTDPHPRPLTPSRQRPSVFATDYLSARSPKQPETKALQSPGGESDWPCRSPYSVD